MIAGGWADVFSTDFVSNGISGCFTLVLAGGAADYLANSPNGEAEKHVFPCAAGAYRPQGGVAGALRSGRRIAGQYFVGAFGHYD